MTNFPLHRAAGRATIAEMEHESCTPGARIPTRRASVISIIAEEVTWWKYTEC